MKNNFALALVFGLCPLYSCESVDQKSKKDNSTQSSDAAGQSEKSNYTFEETADWMLTQINAKGTEADQESAATEYRNKLATLDVNMTSSTSEVAASENSVQSGSKEPQGSVARCREVIYGDGSIERYCKDGDGKYESQDAKPLAREDQGEFSQNPDKLIASCESISVRADDDQEHVERVFGDCIEHIEPPVVGCGHEIQPTPDATASGDDSGLGIRLVEGNGEIAVVEPSVDVSTSVSSEDCPITRPEIPKEQKGKKGLKQALLIIFALFDDDGDGKLSRNERNEAVSVIIKALLR